MEVQIGDRLFTAVPDQLAPAISAYAGLQGRTVTRTSDGALRVAGPLAGCAIALCPAGAAASLQAVAAAAEQLLQTLGARVVPPGEVTGALTVELGGFTPAPAGPHRGADHLLARCLTEGLLAYGGEALPRGRGDGASALAMLPPNVPVRAAAGVAAGLLRYAGLSPRQVEMLRLTEALAARPEARSPARRQGAPARPQGAPGSPRVTVRGPDRLVPLPGGQWVSPRARQREADGSSHVHTGGHTIT